MGGAPFQDVGSNQDEGRLYVYYSSDATRPSAPTVKASRRSRGGTVLLRFGARDADNRASELSYRCSVDGKALRACAATMRVRLSAGTHMVRVQARDVAGNRSKTSRVRVKIR